MGALPGYKASVFVSGGASTPQTPIATTDSGDHTTFKVTNPLFRYLDPGVPVTVQSKNDEVQTVAITGAPTGGTFTLTFGGNTTSALNWNATAAQVQTALQALASIGAGNALVTGGPGPGTPFTVEFSATLGYAAQALITKASSLTGGSSPDVAITRAQAGSAFATNAGATVQYCGGVVVLAAALLGTPVVQVINGAYFAFSQAIQAKTVEIQTAMNTVDITTFASAQANNGFKSKQVLLGDNTWKINQWHLDNTYLALLGQLMLVSAYTGANANQRLESYAYIKTDDIKFDVKSVNDESLDLESSGPIYSIAS